MEQILTRLKSQKYLKYIQKLQNLNLDSQQNLLRHKKLNVLSGYKPVFSQNHDEIYNSQLKVDEILQNYLNQHKNQFQNSPNKTLFQNYQVSQGIRTSLFDLFQKIKQLPNEKPRIFIPADVYPVYQQLAIESGIHQDQLELYPTYKVDNCVQNLIQNASQDSDIILLTDPNTIADYSTQQQDLDLLYNWLQESQNRTLMIDTVYNFNLLDEQKYDRFLQNSNQNKNFVLMHSLSKSYQLPMTFGINFMTPHDTQQKLGKSHILHDIQYTQPQAKQLNKVNHRLQQQPYMPLDQLSDIQQNWDLLKYKLKQLDEQFQIPKVNSSYIAPLPNITFDELLERHNIIGVESYIYDIEKNKNNQDSNFSFISCLNSFDEMYHVTVLSNFSVAYDKYSQTYSKKNLKNSTFSDKFFLLTENELQIGFKKSASFMNRLNIQGNQQIVLKTTKNHIDQNNLKIQKNLDTGLGYFIRDNKIKVESVYLLDQTTQNLQQITVEDAYAMSLQINAKQIYNYSELIPRTFSILPVAQGCQAKCPFCFSHTSVSNEVKQKLLKEPFYLKALEIAKNSGAQRAVITGGGEPTMLPFHYIAKMIENCKKYFPRVIMISNGYNLGHMNEEERQQALIELNYKGLDVLAISRHDIETQKTMNLDTQSYKIAQTLEKLNKQNGSQPVNNMKLRWVCVIQKGGVQDEQSLIKYLDNVVQLGGCYQINFKELYVATSQESVYYEEKGNQFCKENQVSLSLITEFIKKQPSFKKLSELPWGSPIYEINWKGKPLQIAAYTEPSVYWERENKMCRSWNLMADGQLFASLEDRNSLLNLEDYEQKQQSIFINNEQGQSQQQQQQQQYVQ